MTTVIDPQIITAAIANAKSALLRAQNARREAQLRAARAHLAGAAPAVEVLAAAHEDERYWRDVVDGYASLVSSEEESAIDREIARCVDQRDSLIGIIAAADEQHRNAISGKLTSFPKTSGLGWEEDREAFVRACEDKIHGTQAMLRVVSTQISTLTTRRAALRKPHAGGRINGRTIPPVNVAPVAAAVAGDSFDPRPMSGSSALEFAAEGDPFIFEANG